MKKRKAAVMPIAGWVLKARGKNNNTGFENINFRRQPMKFLCVKCDEPMQLVRVKSSDGSVCIVFGCIRCSNKTAIVTDSREIQTVSIFEADIRNRAIPSC